MNRKCRSIYQLARKYAGLTQEQAAELLGIGVRTLGGYEACDPVPNDSIVCKMIEIYKTEWLAYEHLKQSTEIGKRYLPDIELSDLAKSVLRLQKEVNDLELVNSDMIDMACDGIIDKHEINKWEHVVKEIKEMAGAALAVVFAKKEAL